MKKFFAIIATVMLAFTMVACGGGNNTAKGKTIYLTYSGTASDKDFNQSLFEDFKAARKAAGDETTYVIEYIEHGPDKVDSEILDWRAPNAPDVYEAASDKIGILYQKGALARVTGAFKTWVQESNSELGVQLSTVNGDIYAFPYTGDNTYYLQYDKSVFTDEDVKSIEALLAKAAENNYQVAYHLKEAFWGGAAMFTFGSDYNIVYDTDGNVVRTEATFSNEAGLKAAKAIYKIMKDPAWVDGSGAPAEDSAIKATISGTWDISNIKAFWGDNYGCAPMPTVTVDGETKNLGAFLGGKFLGVNPGVSAGDPERFVAALELAKFLSGYECQTKRYEEYDIYPCNLEAQKHPNMADDINVATLKAQEVFAHAQTAVPAAFWSAPNNLTAGIEDGTYTEDNLQAAIDAFNKTIIGESSEETEKA